MSAAMTLPQASSTSLLPLDCVTHIDISTLSQSELHALSLFSSASSNRSDDLLLVPKIDPSQFNESAGSRRQTYSRLRRPQSSDASTGHRRRVAGLLSTPKVSPPAQPDDPERNENHAIIAHLKRFISQDPKYDQIDFQPTAAAAVTPSFAAESGARKRKRGRKPKVKGSAVAAGLSGGGEGLGMHIVNKNGAAVDIWALKNSENPFGDELRRRTLGLESEEELLGS